jgi:hypothetical protein
MNRNSEAKYIPGCIHVCHVSSTAACHTTLFQTWLRHSPLRGRNLDVLLAMNSLFEELRCRILLTRKRWLKPLRLPRQIQIRRELLPYRSPSAKETRLRITKRLPFSNIGGDGATQNGIATRGSEGFLAISRRFIFPSQKRRDRTSWPQC